MIHYALRCGSDHEFDGWFRDSTSFEHQAAHGLLECPLCGDTSVARALMAPVVRGSRRAPAPAAEAPLPAVAGPAQTDRAILPAMPDQVRAALQRLRAEVESTCEYVGPRFAEEARRIHAGEDAKRSIYGEATQAESAALAEDGIEVSRIPWIPRADS